METPAQPTVATGVVTVDSRLAQSFDKMAERLRKGQDIHKETTAKLQRAVEFNKKLTDGYKISVNLVIRITKLLQKYSDFFDQLEAMIGSIEQTFLNENDIRFINQATQQNIVEISGIFDRELTKMINLYNKESKADAADVNQLQGLHKQIQSTMAEFVTKQKTSGGGLRKRAKGLKIDLFKKKNKKTKAPTKA